MVTGIIGKKVGMTQVFDPDGTVHPATVIKAGPCVVVQAKGAQTDGYEAVQLGLVEDRAAKVGKPLGGDYKKASVPPTRVRREVRVAAGGDALAARAEALRELRQADEADEIPDISALLSRTATENVDWLRKHQQTCSRALYRAFDELRKLRAYTVSMVYQEPGRALNPTIKVGRQVAEVFETPFAFLMDLANHERRFMEQSQGLRRYFYAMPYQDRLIWGATAGMVRALYERLYGQAAAAEAQAT